MPSRRRADILVLTVCRRVIILNSYNPANLCQNYLGDSEVVGLGTTVPNASYSFTVPGNSNFVVVVNTTGTTTSSEFSGTVSGFFDTTPGPCPSP